MVFGRAGGASQYDDLDGTHVYSSVPSEMVDGIVAALRRQGLKPRVTRATFILDDATV